MLQRIFNRKQKLMEIQYGNLLYIHLTKSKCNVYVGFDKNNITKNIEVTQEPYIIQGEHKQKMEVQPNRSSPLRYVTRVQDESGNFSFLHNIKRKTKGIQIFSINIMDYPFL